MKLRESMRSKVMERLARAWGKRTLCGLGRRAVKVYVIRRSESRGNCWGRAYTRRGYITLHIGEKVPLSDIKILLAHEIAHHINARTPGASGQPHGERFQRILWKVVPRSLWERASSGRWVTGPSAHRPEFKPEDITNEIAQEAA